MAAVVSHPGARRWAFRRALGERIPAAALTACVIVMCAVATALHPPIDPDLGWHLRSGMFILGSHSVPSTDFMSFTAAGQPWFANEWLWDLTIAALYRSAGAVGLLASTALVMTLVSTFVFLTARSRALPPLGCCAAMALALANLKPMVDVRPALAGAALTAAFVWILERYAFQPRSILALTALEILWVNVHGSFVLGIALVALYAVSGTWSWPLHLRLLPLAPIAFVSTSLATVINPRGVSLWGFIISASRLSFNRQFVLAWRPFDIHDPSLAFTTATLAAMALAAALAAKQRKLTLPIPAAVLLVGGTLAVSRSLEFLPLFAVATAPTLPSLLPPLLTGRDRPRIPRWEAVAAVGTGAAVVLAACASLSAARYQGTESKVFPVAAAAAVQRGALQGPLFNAFNWGGYVAWALPSNPQFVDSRTELYGPGLLNDYMKAAGGDTAVLDHYRVALVLIETGSPLDRQLAGLPRWERYYADAQSVVYQRTSPVEGATS